MLFPPKSCILYINPYICTISTKCAIYNEQVYRYIENSIKENWDLDALTDYKGATLQYKDVARKIEKLHIIFEASGIRKGDNRRLRT